MICIAGKNQVAVDALNFSANATHNHELCVLPNRTDRGIDDWQPSLKARATGLGIPVVELDELYSIADLHLFSLEYDRILRPERFTDATLINCHFSLLPKYKGVYTAAWPIINGETETGVTLHLIDRGIDTGPIIDQKRFSIEPNDTARCIYFRCMQHATELLLSRFQSLLANNFDAIEQPANESTYYSRTSIDYSNLTIDLNQTAFVIHNQIRAFTFKEFQLPIVNNVPIQSSSITCDRSNSRSGTVIFDDDHQLKIASLDYDLLLTKHPTTE
jgi:methionyl-tRNA formyltransferase